MRYLPTADPGGSALRSGVRSTSSPESVIGPRLVHPRLRFKALARSPHHGPRRDACKPMMVSDREMGLSAPVPSLPHTPPPRARVLGHARGSGLGRAVTGCVVALLGSCGGETSAGADAAVTDAAAVATTCPTHLRFTFVEGNRSDVGWTGNLHGSTISKDAFFRVAVQECDAACRNCRFEGPIRDPAISTQRCLSDTSQTCSTDAECPPWECRYLVPTAPQAGKICAHNSAMSCTEDSDCGPSACRFFVGPAFPISAPRTCLGTFLDTFDDRPPVAGTIDLQTGQVRMERLTIATGAVDSGKQGACPVCVGDTKPNDGIKGGTCAVNPRMPVFPYEASQSCDTNGFGLLTGYQFQYSLDCTAPLGRSIVLDVRRATTGGVRFELGADQPTCNGEACWCGLCEGTLQTCHTSGECAGVPCVGPTDLPGRANACVTACAWDATTQRGTCETQDPPQGDAGLPPRRTVSCFPGTLGDEIVAQGSTRILSSEEYSIQLASVSCAPPVRAVSMSPASIAADRAIGLPGPMFNLYKLNVRKEYAP